MCVYNIKVDPQMGKSSFEKIRVRFFVVLLGVLLSFVSTIVSCVKKDSSPTKPKFEKTDKGELKVNDSSSLEFKPLLRKPFASGVSVTGKVSVPETNLIQVTSRFSGRVESLKHVVGEPIKQGDVLATVWSPDLATAAAEYFAVKKQKQEKLMSLTRVRLTNLGMSESDLKSENQEIFPIRSPLTGVVIERKASPGGQIQSGDILFLVGRITQFEFVGEVPPEEARLVRSQMRVDFPDFPELSGTVVSISPVADARSHLNRVRVSLPKTLPTQINFESLIKGRIVVSETPEWVVPLESLFRDNESDLIFASSSSNKDILRRIRVQVKSQNDTEAALVPFENIENFQNVVSKGVLQLESIFQN